MSEPAVTYELDSLKQRKQEALVEVEQQRAIAETKAAIFLAKQFPRDTIEATKRILNACMRPGLADAALYTYARGGTDITGPSIRLAECLAQNWGNLQFGIRELEQRNGVSTVEAFAWDMETNVRQTKTFQVTHKRHTKKGDYDITDPRDIYETVANQGARRLRACILGIIPGDVVEAAVVQAEATLKTKVDITEDRVRKMVDKLAEYGVTKKMIEKRIQRNLDAITPAQMVAIGKIYNSLKDGMSAPADHFDMDVPKAKVDDLNEKLKPAPDPIDAYDGPVAPDGPSPEEKHHARLAELQEEKGYKAAEKRVLKIKGWSDIRDVPGDHLGEIVDAIEEDLRGGD